MVRSRCGTCSKNRTAGRKRRPKITTASQRRIQQSKTKYDSSIVKRIT